MTIRVFIAGSMSIKDLNLKVKERIDKIVAQNFEIVIGDADGVDASIQTLLVNYGKTRTTIFCSGKKPRNNVGNWPVKHVETNFKKGSRAFFTAKDISMAKSANIGLMIWDTKSIGTLSNVIELLAQKKTSVVFLNEVNIFKNISTVEHFEELLLHMSDSAKQMADKKIKLFDQINSLKQKQFEFK